MYCPKCNQHYRKKYGKKRECACGYRFVFGHDDVIKDRLMLFLERKASQNGTHYFTMDTLYAVYQKLQIKPFPSVRRTTLSQNALAQKYERWQRYSSLRSDQFIDKPSLQQPENSIGYEVFEYGVEQIIVVDEPIKVDLLVKNNKHLNKNALIISSEGYPAYLKPHLQTLLQKQTTIPVSFLYEANQTIHEQQTRFERKCQVKLQPGQIRDLSVNQTSTTVLTVRSDSIANDSINVIQKIGVGILIFAIIFGIMGILILNKYNVPTDKYPTTSTPPNPVQQITVPENVNDALSVNENIPTWTTPTDIDLFMPSESTQISKPACYKLTVNAIPSDSRIRIMNIKPKYKHGICLKKGRYDIYVTRKNYNSYREWIKIEESDVSIDDITLEKQ